MSNTSIWPIDRTLSGATNLGQNGSESDGNKEVLHIPQSSSITGTLPSDCLVSYSRHSLGQSYPSAETQSKRILNYKLLEFCLSITVQYKEQLARWYIAKIKMFFFLGKEVNLSCCCIAICFCCQCNAVNNHETKSESFCTYITFCSSVTFR